ncbi:MAG: hypothetical protein JNL19_06935 [Burkholderiales bacterium]|nr:hypothetical protein [Burkholderiales bacterium]
MIESGLWIFLLETLGAGAMFAALIWWIVRGAADRNKKLRDYDEAARRAADAADEKRQ